MKSKGFVAIAVLITISAIAFMLLSVEGLAVIAQKQHELAVARRVLPAPTAVTQTPTPTSGECQQDSDCKLISNDCTCAAVAKADSRTTLFDPQVDPYRGVCKQNECSGPQIPVTAVCQQNKCVRSDKIQPAAVDTSTWQTYRNEQHGVEMKYPPTYNLVEENNITKQPLGSYVVSLSDPQRSSSEFSPGLSIGAWTNLRGYPASSTISALLGLLKKENGIRDVAVIKVNGIDAITFTYEEDVAPGGFEKSIWFLKNNLIYEVSLVPPGDPYFEASASTFKFIEPSSSSSIVDKICAQEQQAVQVSQCGAFYSTYPAGFVVDAATKLYDANGSYLKVFCGGYVVPPAVPDARCAALKDCKVVKESCHK